MVKLPMKFLTHIDLSGVAKILNIPAPTEANDLVTKSFMEDKINKAIAGFDFQADVRAVQKDTSLIPFAPVKGDRYVITAPSNLDTSFGTIDGLEANDIVEYDGTKFVVAYDVSERGDGVLLFSQEDNQYFKFIDDVWSFGGLTVITAGNGLEDTDGTFSVKVDNSTIGLNVGNQLELLNQSVTRAKLGLDLTGLGLQQQVDGRIEVKLNDTRLAVDTDGIKMVETYTKKGSALVGDGTATSFVVTHNLNTRDVLVQVVDAVSFATVHADVTRSDANSVAVSFGVAPTVDQYRVIVIG
jgi:hypothetical protein